MLRDRRQNRCRILFLAALLVFTACNDSEPLNGTPTTVLTTTPSVSPTIALPEGLVKWQAQLGDYTVDDGLVVAEGTAYVVTWHSNRDDFRNLAPCLCAFDVQTGAKKWAFTYAGSEASAPTVSSGLVFFTVSQPMPESPENSISFLYALDATTGEEKWHFDHQIGGIEPAQPLVEDDIVYFASLGDRHEMYDTTGIIHGEPNIHALRADTGELLWKVKINADTWPAATIDKGTLYFVEQIKYTGISDEFYIKALDLRTRNIKWQFTISDRYNNVDKLIVANGRVYFRYRYGDTIRALDAETGEVTWNYTADTGGSISRPTGSCCLFSLSKVQKQATQDDFSIRASTVYTSYALPGPGLKTLPEVAGDTLLVGLGLRQGTPDSENMWGDMDGYMLGLDAVTGKERWRTNVHRVLNGWPAPTVKKEIAYLVAFTAEAPWEPAGPVSIYALDTRSGSILWDKSLNGLPLPHVVEVDNDMLIAAGWEGDVYAIPLPIATP